MLRSARTTLCSMVAMLLGIAPHLRAQPPLVQNVTAPPGDRHASGRSATDHLDRWTKVSVQLPASAALFPAGEGAPLANSYCLICHSVDMVLTQPPRTAPQWTETINKMRSAYGAPVPADQVGALALYLSRIGASP